MRSGFATLANGPRTYPPKGSRCRTGSGFADEYQCPVTRLVAPTRAPAWAWLVPVLGLAASPGSLATSPRPLLIKELPTGKQCLQVDPQEVGF